MAMAPLTFNTSQTAILMADFHREGIGDNPMVRRYNGHKITLQREDLMDGTISIPDDMAHHLQEKWGDDLARRALESLALEAYRERLIGASRLQRW